MNQADELLRELMESVNGETLGVENTVRFLNAHQAARAYLNEKPHEPPSRAQMIEDDLLGLYRASASPPHAAAEPPRIRVGDSAIGRYPIRGRAMTTLDDAAERQRIRTLAEGIWEALTLDEAAHSLQRALDAATEAAAKKCDAYAKREAEHIGLRVGAEECAAAIRGKP